MENLNNVNKTLYIPLYGKALASKKGIIINDKKAEEIWDSQQFLLKGKAKSKWLAYYMGMRSAVFDKWVIEELDKYPNSVVIHLGCGLDSRNERVKAMPCQWYDVDFEAVIDERKRYYKETAYYHMVSADIRETAFVDKLLKADSAIVVLEGISMYLTNGELKQILSKLNEKYPNLSVLVDCYTPFAVKMSKIKNPINSVGVTKVYGIESPKILQENTGLSFVKEREITPKYLIDQLSGYEKFIFKLIYAGKTSKKLYKLFEYKS